MLELICGHIQSVGPFKAHPSSTSSHNHCRYGAAEHFTMLAAIEDRSDTWSNGLRYLHET
jgi:hypothetical protein